VLPLGELAGVADIVVEAAPPALFMDVALPAAEAPSPSPARPWWQPQWPCVEGGGASMVQGAKGRPAVQAGRTLVALTATQLLRHRAQVACGAFQGALRGLFGRAS
jgi:hypothetical protein